MDALCCRAFTMQNAMQSEQDAVRVAPSVRRSVRPSGVLRVRHVYDRLARDDAEVAEELLAPLSETAVGDGAHTESAINISDFTMEQMGAS